VGVDAPTTYLYKNERFKMTEQEFYDKYRPIQNHIENRESWDGMFFDTFGKELDFIEEMSKFNRVVTIVESDNECTEETTGLVVVSGLCVVNTYGYMVTAIPLEESFEIIID
jgi:hypothetical protein